MRLTPSNEIYIRADYSEYLLFDMLVHPAQVSDQVLEARSMRVVELSEFVVDQYK